MLATVVVIAVVTPALVATVHQRRVHPMVTVLLTPHLPPPPPYPPPLPPLPRLRVSVAQTQQILCSRHSHRRNIDLVKVILVQLTQGIVLCIQRKVVSVVVMVLVARVQVLVVIVMMLL